MHVGVEKIVDEYLREERFDAAFGKQLHIRAGRDELTGVGDRYAVDPFEDEHVFARMVPIHPRYIQQWRFGEVAAELCRIGAFVDQIQFVQDRIFIILRDFDEMQAPRINRNTFEQPRDGVQKLQILTYYVADTRTNHFDDDVFPGA